MAGRAQLTAVCLVVEGFSEDNSPATAAQTVARISKVPVLRIAKSTVSRTAWIIQLSSDNDQKICKTKLREATLTTRIKPQYPGLNDIPEESAWIDISMTQDDEQEDQGGVKSDGTQGRSRPESTFRHDANCRQYPAYQQSEEAHARQFNSQKHWRNTSEESWYASATNDRESGMQSSGSFSELRREESRPIFEGPSRGRSQENLDRYFASGDMRHPRRLASDERYGNTYAADYPRDNTQENMFQEQRHGLGARSSHVPRGAEKQDHSRTHAVGGLSGHHGASPGSSAILDPSERAFYPPRSYGEGTAAYRDPGKNVSATCPPTSRGYFRPGNEASETFPERPADVSGEQKSTHSRLYPNLHPSDDEHPARSTFSTSASLTHEPLNLSSEEKLVQRTVDVLAGKHPLLTEDICRDHFENARHMGGNIEKITLETDEKLIRIVFEDQKVAERVLNHPHDIGGHPVLLRRFTPQPFYSNKLFFRGVPENVTTKYLKLYMRDLSGCDAQHILFGEKLGTVLVTFRDLVDAEKMKIACKQNPLENSELTVSRLPITKCVMVKNLPSNMMRGYIELHFKEKGGKIERIEMKPEEGKCFVFFENPEAVDRVMKEDHILEDATLEVKPYIPDLGQMGGNEDPNVFTLPKPVVLGGDDDDDTQHKFTLLRKSSTAWTGLREQLSLKHAEPTLAGCKLQIDCKLSSSIQRARFLAVSWEEEVLQTVNEYLGLIEVSRRNVMTLMWDKVEEAFTKEGIACSEGAIIERIPGEAFVVVGMRSTVEDLMDKIDTIAKAVEVEEERKKEEITEKMKLRPYKVQLLSLSSFDKEVGSATLKVEIQEDRIVFQGHISDVKSALSKMSAQLENLKYRSVPFPKERRDVFLKEKSVQFVRKNMKNARTIAAWDTNSDGELVVYAFDENNLSKAVEIIQNSVIERTAVPMDKETMRAMESKEWQRLLKSLELKYDQCIKVLTQDNIIVVISTNENVDEATHRVEMFFRQNAMYMETVTFSPSRQKLAANFLNAKIRGIENNLTQEKVQIQVTEESIKIQGTRDGMQQAKTELDKLQRAIATVEVALTDEAKVKFMQSETRDQDLEYLSMKHQCVVSCNPETPALTVTSQAQPQKDQSFNKAGASASGIQHPEGVSILVKYGDITQMEQDVIVNAANSELQHVVGLAKAIVDRGGVAIQTECDRLMKERSGRKLSDGEVLMSGPGRLPCKAIVHAVGPYYAGGHSGERESLAKAVWQSLQCASQAKYRSIAIPAISSGVYMYPLKESTRVIVETVKTFFDSQKESSIRRVILCGYQEEIVRHFKNNLNIVFPSNSSRPRHSFSPPTPQAVDSTSTSDEEDDQEDEEEANESAAAGASSSNPRVTVPQTSVQATAVGGEIAKQIVDVIVNSASLELDLQKGAVSSSILKAAGQGLQKECTSKYGRRINPGDIAVTKGHNLQCSEVFHVALKDWTSGAEKLLTEVIVKCLREASSRGHASIAFPVLGTGVLAYPKDLVVQAMADAVSRFQLNVNNRHLKEIKIVVYEDQQMLQKFRDQLVLGRTSATGSSATGGKYSAVNRGPTPVVNYVYNGKIEKETADVIVNSTKRDLQFDGGPVIGRCISKEAGKGLQNECRNNYPRGLQRGEIGVTGGHGLACKEVYHVVLQNWEDGADKKLHELVYKCLELANGKGHRSIAFPVLGAGGFGYPPEIAAKTMLNAIARFCQDQPSTSLTEVKIVIFEGKLRKVFENITLDDSAPSSGQRESRQFSEYNTHGRFTNHSTRVFEFPGLKLVVKQGDITDEEVGGIVCNTDCNHDLKKGVISRILEKKCGRRLEDEIKAKEAAFRKEGLIWVTSYNLKTNLIILFNADPIRYSFGTERGNGPSSWENAIKLCCTRADELGLQSVAFPLFGTDREARAIPPQKLAEYFFKEAKKFSGKKKTLKEIRLVVFENDYVDQVHTKMVTMAEKAKVTTREERAEEKRPPRYTQTDTKLYVYACHGSLIQTFLSEFDKVVNRQVLKREITDEIIQDLNEEQIESLKDIGKMSNVSTEIDRAHGRMELYGLTLDVMDALDRCSKFLQNVSVSAMVQWHFLEVNQVETKIETYPPGINRIIEEAFSRNRPTCEFADKEGRLYVVDYSDLKEYPKDEPNNKVEVIRRVNIRDPESGMSQLPVGWALQRSNEAVKLVNISSIDPEYKAVETNLMFTLGNRNVTIIRVERVQNPSLYRQYQAKKAELNKQNDGDCNEKVLWHGTASEATPNINRYGFSRSYCGKNATAHGQGVYFAVRSEYSTQRTYSPPDSNNGDRFIYQCKVLVGKSVQSSSAMRFPPKQPGTSVKYDSATDNPSHPSMYIIFNDIQAYPEYMITFK